jgi:hypothetical protein
LPFSDYVQLVLEGEESWKLCISDRRRLRIHTRIDRTQSCILAMFCELDSGSLSAVID